MYKLCIIGLSIIFILSINGVLSQFLCGRFEGSWVLTKDPTLEGPLFGSMTDYNERKNELRHTVKSEVTPDVPFQAVWYPEFRHREGGAFLPYSHYFLLKLHQFEGNELSLVDASGKTKYMYQVGMLLCKKSYGECAKNYKGQVSYVEDGDEIGIYIIPEDRFSLAVHYFINGVPAGNTVKLYLQSFKTLLPAVTFAKPGLVTMKECKEEPPERLLIDIEFMAGRTPAISFDFLMDYYKSKKPNDSELFNFNKYKNSWMFRDDFIVCKSQADRSKVPRLTQSKDRRLSLNVFINHRNENEIIFDFVFRLVNSCITGIRRDLVNNTWSKFAPVIRTRMLGLPDIQALEDWLTNFLSSANTVFLGPKGKSLHIADDTCAINLKY